MAKFEDIMAKFEDMDNSPKSRQVPSSFKKMPKTKEIASVPVYAEPANVVVRPYRETAIQAAPERPSDLNLVVLQENLTNCLQIIDDEVMRGYITRLSEYPLVCPDNQVLKDIHFFRITELVYEKDEFSSHKLATVFHVLSNHPCTLVLMLRSDGETCHFYLGVRALDEKNSTGTMKKKLENSLCGLFPGSRTGEFRQDELEKLLDQIKTESCSVSSVTCIADDKRTTQIEENKSFIQGLEKFVASMSGQKFTAIFIADNLGYDSLMHTKQDYESIYTQLAPFANMQMNFTDSESDGESTASSRSASRTSSHGTHQTAGTSYQQSQTNTDGTSQSTSHTDTTGSSESVADGTSKTKTNTTGISATVSRSSTKGESQSTAHGDTVGGSVGTYVGGGVGVVHAGESASVNYNHSYTRTTGTSSSKTNGTSRSRNQSTSLAAAVNKTLTHGTSSSAADTTGETLSRSTSLGESHGTNEQKGTSYSVANGFSLMNSRTLSSTLGSSQGITLNAQNKTLLAMMEKIDKQLKRIEECESAGMWEFAAYFLADNRGTSETAASIYRSLISGEQTCLEHSAINTWDIASSEDLLLKEYLLKFRHPRFCYSGFDYDASRQVMISPAAMTSTNELAIQMGLPRKSVCGLPVIEHAEFAREVVAYHNNREDKASFELGRIFHMGKEYTTKVALQRDSMTMHTFITGATGSGKSNAVYNILDKLCRSSQEQIPFLVIEPAKGEYKHVFGQNLDVHVYGANPHTAPLLKINPFSFPHRIHVLEHLDRLVEIFNVCWPMYAAMPAVLKSAVEKAYTDCGWNLTESINEYGEDLYPSFADVARNIKSIIDSSEYDTENKGAYKGSLLTRLNSLSNGINGLIFSSDEIADADLFDRNVIVDLSRVGSAETKSLIMGMLVLKLQEYRMAQDEMNAPLRHITVLEEAHHLLKHTSSEQHAESSNLLGKSVEMLTNSIAEMRTYGEGFIIADQSPALLDRAVIRNTNTKVILRLADRSDCELTGLSVGLNENQLQELTKLERGGAVIYQNDWIAPVLCKIDKFEIPEGKYTYTHSKSAAAQKHPADSVYIAELLSRGEAVAKEVLEADILPKLKALGMGASVQIAAIRMLHNPSSEPDMVRLAPIMSALLPRVRAAIEQAYQNTSDAAEWTKYAEKILIEIAGREMDRKISGRIIQAIVTDYVYVELNRLDDLRIWTESGGLR